MRVLYEFSAMYKPAEGSVTDLRNCEVCDIHIPFLSYVNMSGMQDLHSILKSCKYVRNIILNTDENSNTE
ncbi:hypothetical protein KUTeg_010113 [Tegillarca granosa]|uniref:Uncharacterized protein n=1 Tax=Tegillarca granosa TaxID=220873 RepID=A0ABQ9F5U5_TEGGR|nr:hypothetical protein KUTeg_010113 [Tegillarca granosa]